MKGSHHVQQPNQYFAFSKDEWNTKEDTGKSMKNVCTYCGMPKGTCQEGEATLNSQKTKPVAIAIIEFYACLKASGMQTGSQSVSRVGRS